MTETNPFADVLEANLEWASTVPQPELDAVAARGLAVLTCMDSRIDPLGMLGLKKGDAKILRNAGARVTQDVLRTTVLASYLLGVTRLMIVQHTGCRMAQGTEADVHRAITDAGGPDTRSISFKTTTDQEAALRHDVQRITSWPYLNNLSVGGFLLDLKTGRIGQVC
ncbi:MAG: beta-class carbonic anhydrase [Actinomycetales bacterium]